MTATSSSDNNNLLSEIRGMREDFRQVSTDVAALTVEVKHLVEQANSTRDHGERIKALETEVSGIRANEQSAATERRWIIGVLVTSLFGVMGAIIAIVNHFSGVVH